MTRRFLASFVVPFFAVTAHAGPKVLASAPILNEAGGIACMVSNAGPKPITVTDIVVWGIPTQGPMLPEPTVLEAGQLVVRNHPEPTMAFCEFTIEGSTKGVRAAVCHWLPGETDLGFASECVEAR